MCGRYTTRRPSIIAEIFDLAGPATGIFTTHYNMPFMRAPLPFGRRSATGKHEVALGQWGLVPSWAPDLSYGYNTFNARAETIQTKPSFKAAFKFRRCLVPVDGFYEPEKINGEKTGRYFFFELPGSQPFCLAGLWESWGKGDQVTESFTITTTEPNEMVGAVHDRMPVILHEKDYDRWLDEPAGDLLVPYSGALKSWEVSPQITKMSDADPKSVQPWQSEVLF